MQSGMVEANTLAEQATPMLMLMLTLSDLFLERIQKSADLRALMRRQDGVLLEVSAEVSDAERLGVLAEKRRSTGRGDPVTDGASERRGSVAGAREPRLVPIAAPASASALASAVVLSLSLGLMPHVLDGMTVPALVYLVHVLSSDETSLLGGDLMARGTARSRSITT